MIRTARVLRKLADLLDPRVPPSEGLHIVITADSSQAQGELLKLQAELEKTSGHVAQNFL
jgi:hypothetical protein